MLLPQTLSLLAPTLNNTSLLTPFNGTALRPGAFPDGSTASAPLRDIIANGTNITARFETENRSFPPRSWLGYGLDMTTVTPGTYFRGGFLTFEALGRVLYSLLGADMRSVHLIFLSCLSPSILG